MNKITEVWSTLNFYMKVGVVIVLAIIFYFLVSTGFNFIDSKKEQKYIQEKTQLLIEIEKLKTESEIKDLEIEKLNKDRAEIQSKIIYLDSIKPKKRDKPASFSEIDEFFKTRGF